jgi:predicted nucleic acid-binding protein
MRTAVDTSVLLDVLGADPAFGLASRAGLRAAYDAGALVASDVVWAEVRANFPSDPAFEEAMAALGVQFLPLTPLAASLAGSLWREHHLRRRRDVTREDPKRMVADFLIGAHAQIQADTLLARDRGFFRSCFTGLRVTEP